MPALLIRTSGIGVAGVLIIGLLLCSPRICSAAVTDVASNPAPQRVQDGLLILYDFSASDDSLVPDRSGVAQPLDLRMDDPKAAKLSAGGLKIVSNTLIHSGQPATRLSDAIRQSGAITIEAWVLPAKTNQSGPARILTLSRNANERNFTLGQDGDKFEVRLRTTKTSNEDGAVAAVMQETPQAMNVHRLRLRDSHAAVVRWLGAPLH
jgi:hypothetical protein